MTLMDYQGLPEQAKSKLISRKQAKSKLISLNAGTKVLAGTEVWGNTRPTLHCLVLPKKIFVQNVTFT